MNSSIQCLHSFEELKEPLSKFIKVGAPSSDANMIASARDLWRQIDGARSAVAPNDLWQQLRTNHVRFDEQVRPGIYQQQDAEEFLSIMVQSLKTKIGSTTSLFEIELEESYTNLDDNTDVIKRKSVESKLICRIDEKTVHTTDSLDQFFVMGASADAKEVLSVFSQKANRDVQATKDLKMSKVPTYLTLQYARFFAKRKEGEVISVKITKPVDIPLSLDIYKFCTPSLQSTLKRESSDLKKNVVVENKDEIMEVEENKEKTNTGVYDLYAVLTHQGRSLQGGHYVAFVRQSSDENDWLLFDDEKVTPKKSSDVKNLSGLGGADGHIAYICFYRARLA
jgi:ubiquitin carboxyl-terminal hydrolase 14